MRERKREMLRVSLERDGGTEGVACNITFLLSLPLCGRHTVPARRPYLVLRVWGRKKVSLKVKAGEAVREGERGR